MTEIKRNIKTRILTFGLIILAGIPTFFINSFSHPAIIIILPGILFGLALTIPYFDKSRKQIIAIVTLPIIMVMLYVVSIGLGLGFGFINNSYADKTGVIIVGIISALCFVFVIDQYFSIKNRKISYSAILILGLASVLICDYIFLKPHSKELNLGKMIVIWEVLIGLGLTTIVRFDD